MNFNKRVHFFIFILHALNYEQNSNIHRMKSEQCKITVYCVINFIISVC